MTGEGGPIIVPDRCDLTKSPNESPACIEDGVGVFVSPTGKDGAAGTKADPLRSIGEAATRGKARVYVCAGTYETAVTLAKPIAIFGGLSCAWEPTGARPKLAPLKGVALKITKVSGPVLIQDIDVVGSADAAVPGDSAIAAFVSESTDVTFRNVSLTSGAGTAGATGGMTSNYSGTATVGGNAMGAVGGVGPSCSCLDGNSSKGGNGGGGTGGGVTDGVAVPSVGTPNGGGTLTTATCNPGQVGANGAANPGGEGQTSPGSLTALGWRAPSTTTPRGSTGNPAQGGGGGGARTNIAAGGGGGGCGGCGGGGGDPGGAGGSSFALLSFQSTVVVVDGQLGSGNAGTGGTGGTGQGGQAGGGAGSGACNGGVGGNGGGGSGGGGGAGGHSVPVAFVGKEPTANGATLAPGAKGAGGPGGQGGIGPGNAGNAGKPGAEGKSQNTLAL